mmetsp:Transcript_19287/g.48205  ORF Transcript_19287/g.48205 Transcript_19287/m.48205 type:complete len:231 (+) Transcript_19287:1012-1704(+)
MHTKANVCLLLHHDEDEFSHQIHLLERAMNCCDFNLGNLLELIVCDTVAIKDDASGRTTVHLGEMAHAVNHVVLEVFEYLLPWSLRSDRGVVLRAVLVSGGNQCRPRSCITAWPSMVNVHAAYHGGLIPHQFEAILCMTVGTSKLEVELEQDACVIRRVGHTVPSLALLEKFASVHTRKWHASASLRPTLERRVEVAAVLSLALRKKAKHKPDRILCVHLVQLVLNAERA